MLLNVKSMPVSRFSVGFLLVVIFYVFAIIGMEALHGRVFPGCWYVVVVV